MAQQPEPQQQLPQQPQQPPKDTYLFIRNHAYVKRDKASSTPPPFVVKTLGEGTIPNAYEPGPYCDGMKTMMTPTFHRGNPVVAAEYADIAGPRAKLFFDPSKVTAAIVTCGGLCPGLNNIVRALVLALAHRYGVPTILGFKYGYEGLTPNHDPILLTASYVKDIHVLGGSVLKSSRGEQKPEVMVDTLVKYGVDILFTIGGDGTQGGAYMIAQEISRRGLKIGVVGLPKTIDNDICYTDATFGFNTAVTMAQAAISAVHCEARSARGGIGFVKLMGRDAGFIALHAALSNGDVNLVLIPEVKFRVEVVLRYLEQRLTGTAGHAVIVMAEGAGQHLLADLPDEYDKSGNRLQKDAAKYLIRRIQEHFKAKGIECNLKFVDPSYTIRGAPAIPSDQLLCHCLATNAVHAAMAGMTEVVVCHHHNTYIYVPINRAIYYVKRVNAFGPLYRMLLDATGMPTDLEEGMFSGVSASRALRTSSSSMMSSPLLFSIARARAAKMGPEDKVVLSDYERGDAAKAPAADGAAPAPAAAPAEAAEAAKAPEAPQN
eukprot:m51a1_g10351 putative PPi-dependent phosphofructokinase (546) ;mRNA; r:186539-189291